MAKSKYKLILGDCMEKMQSLGESSIDSVVTDPPYGLEFMGEEWGKLGATNEFVLGTVQGNGLAPSPVDMNSIGEEL
jgi:DNA modification methylase